MPVPSSKIVVKFDFFVFLYYNLIMIWVFILSFLSVLTVADPIRVVVLDSGLDLEDPRFSNVLCKDGHYDATGEGIKDFHGHGTHSAGLIKKYASGNYCITIVKYYPKTPTQEITTRFYKEALVHAIRLNPTIINISGGGGGEIPFEFFIITHNPAVKFIVAAGNDGENLDVRCSYFPACYNYSNIMVVGALTNGGKRRYNSNYGNVVQHWEIGEDVESECLDKGKCRMSGTSMSTAIFTGKLVKQITDAK